MQRSSPLHGPGDPVATGEGSATSFQTACVLLLAVCLRLLVVWTVIARYPRAWFFTRGVEMGLLAQSIVSGQGLSSPFGASSGPTAFIAPGYPLLIAAVFRVLGSYSLGSLIFILGVQTGISLLTVWLIMHVARVLSGQGAAWIAGLLWACSLPLLWMPTIFWDTCFSACIVLGFLAAALRDPARFRRKDALLYGVACGFTGLLNPALLPATGMIVLWLAWQSRLSKVRTFAGLFLAAAAFVVVFGAWPVRNAKVFHAFIPLRTTVGFELWMGNREGASGFLDESVFPMYNQRELNAYRTMGEVAYTNHKSELAKAYILSHPRTFLELTARRIARFWTGTGSRGGSAIFALHACATTFLGVAGLCMLYRRRGVAMALLFGLPLLVFPLPYYITHAEFRYRLVIDPLLAVLTGCALAWGWERLASRKPADVPATVKTDPRQVALA